METGTWYWSDFKCIFILCILVETQPRLIYLIYYKSTNQTINVWCTLKYSFSRYQRIDCDPSFHIQDEQLIKLIKKFSTDVRCLSIGSKETSKEFILSILIFDWRALISSFSWNYCSKLDFWRELMTWENIYLIHLMRSAWFYFS